MALTAIQASSLNNSKPQLTTSAPQATDAISTILNANGATLLVGDQAVKDTNYLINCLDRLRDQLLENNK